MTKNLIVAQSGGPTSAINSSLVGVIKKAKSKKEIGKTFGAIHGVIGIINNNLKDLNLSESELDTLFSTPAAYLGSARLVLSNDFDDENYASILHTIKENNVGYIAFIGGNDSMDTVDKLSRFFIEKKIDCNVIGVPKTIDNDLILTDHTPGYGSAIKYIANTMAELKLDTSVYEKGRVTIVEIMGRDAGWLTAGSKLASIHGLGPDFIYLPEVAFDKVQFLSDINKRYDENKKVLVAVSEGLRDQKGEYVLNAYSYNANNDVFGHMQLGGLSTVLAAMVKEEINLPVRSIELNLMQRCSSRLCSLTDLDEAKNCGMFAVDNVLSTSGMFVSMNRLSNDPYTIRYELIPVNDVANKVKLFPKNWIIDGNDISSEYIDYALPLIQGQVEKKEKDGLFSFLVR